MTIVSRLPRASFAYTAKNTRLEQHSRPSLHADDLREIEAASASIEIQGARYSENLEA